MPIGASVKLGDMGVEIYYPALVNLYGCQIGAGTTIGPFVEIQKGVVIGKNCTISSHSLLCEGVTLADNVFIGHGVIFCNEKHPQANRPGWTLPPENAIFVGTAASIGSGAVILPGVIIGVGAEVGAGAVVTRNVPAGATVVGNPAVLIENRHRCMAEKRRC